MVDSVLDWDSLWSRTKKVVRGIEEIRDKNEFKARMQREFFKGYNNPKGQIGRHDMLSDELWNRYSKKIDTFTKAIQYMREKGREWKEGYKISEFKRKGKEYVAIREKGKLRGYFSK